MTIMIILQDGSSALICASINGNIEIVNELLKYGANINLQDNVSCIL